ncbi:MAG: T9SS type A sorting domain-containing protein [Candidatus Eisenbacteria bacterium]|nr:T9SS type A sorting domain-containing protein [Candidatus Eisenbacteria bacterium]
MASSCCAPPRLPQRRSVLASRVTLPLLMLALAALLSALPARAAWQQWNGPEAPAVYGLARSGSVLLLGSNEGDAGDVYRSTDGGTSWVNAGLPNAGITFLYPHLGNVYAGTYLDGLYRTRDAGTTWEKVGQGMPPSEIVSAMVSIGGSVLLVGFDSAMGRKLYRSADAGESWAEVAGSPTVHVRSMVVSGHAFLGTDGDGLFRSSDSGVTWWPWGAGLPELSRIDALTSSNGILYAALTKNGAPEVAGIYRSVDAGSTWTRVSADLPDVTLYYFSFLVGNGGALYTGIVSDFGGAGVYRSVDGGAHWTRITEGIAPETQPYCLLPSGGVLFAGTDAGLWKTADVGQTWSYAGRGTAAIRGVGALLKSGGALHVGLSAADGSGRGIWRTFDDGATWELADGNFPNYTTALDLLDGGSYLLAALFGLQRGVFRSTDGGLTWIPSSDGIPSDALLGCLAKGSGFVLAGGYDALYRSTDDGVHWGTVPGVAYVNAIAAQGSDLFAGTGDRGVIRSTDMGLTWFDESQGLDSPEARYVNALALANGRMFAATQGAGVYAFDAGRWVPAGLDGEDVHDVTAAGTVLLAGTSGGKIYYTANGGHSWVDFGDGYAGGDLYELYGDGEWIYAGTTTHALWARPAGELDPASVGTEDALAPLGLEPARAFPNPFSATTRLSLRIPPGEEGSLEVFDVGGRAVARVSIPAGGDGERSILFDGSALPAGVYLCRLRAAGAERTSRLVIGR